MNIEFTAFPRKSEGRGANRRMRRAGKAPGIVYGGTQNPESIELDHNALFHALRNEAFHASVLDMEVAGEKSQALLRDYQMHPFRPMILHADFQRVDANKKIHMKVPLHFANGENSPAVKVSSAIVSHVITEIDISCLPKDLPEFITVDLANLQAGHSLHLSGITLPAGVEANVQKGEDPTVATIVIPKVMTAEEELAEAALLTAAPAAAEVPTIAQKAKEDETAGSGGGAGSKPTVKDDKKNMKEAKK